MTKRRTILMSIKPEYAELIYKGVKKFEYRKKGIRSTMPLRIVLYETFPVGKVTGEIRVDKMIKETPEEVWSKTNEWGGISKEKFDKYYKDTSISIAYHVKSFRKYKKSKELWDYKTEKGESIKEAPLSYRYIN